MKGFGSPTQTSYMSDKHGSSSKRNAMSPGKVVGSDGKPHEMSIQEMKARYLEIEEGHKVTHL